MQKLFPALALAAYLLACAAPTAAQDALLIENKHIIQMVRAKLAPDLIIQKIKTSRCRFDTFPGVLAELKHQGVPNEVLSAMVSYRDPETEAPAPAAPPQKEREERRASDPDNIGGVNLRNYRTPAAPAKAPAASAGRLALEATETDDEKPTMADTRITPGSTVYIDEMGGFEHYLAAALRKKTVPLIVVLDPMAADYIIFGTSEGKKAGWAKMFFLGDGRSMESAGITIVDRRTKVVVFSDSSHRYSALRGKRSTAEKLAKYLDRKITRDQKQPQ